MATTQTKNGKTGAPAIEAAFEQVKELNEQMLAAARKAGNLYVDSYEKAVDRTLELELKVAGLSQQEWLKNLIETRAEITRELATSYTSAARSLLK
jgi:hypothetical protein